MIEVFNTSINHNEKFRLEIKTLQHTADRVMCILSIDALG